MRGGTALYTYTFLADESILLFKILGSVIDKDNASKIYDTYTNETSLPDFTDFIMDATAVTEISDPAIGILMKSMAIMKKAKGYLVLVMTEDFLQKIMVAHPEMFNYMAVFHSVVDARAFIKRSKK
jgi:anti-anti-sigma regulatory factor